MSALSSQQNDTKQNLTEQQENLPTNSYLIPPEEIDTLWNHFDPRDYFSQKLRKHIEEYDENLKKTEGISINQFDQFNNYYEQPELNWLSDYYINNLIFFKRDMNLTDNAKTCELLQVLWDLLDWKNKQSRPVKDQYNLKFQFLTENLQKLHNEKLINRDEARKILEYTRRTYFRHFHLYNYCIQNKQVQVEKPVTIFIPHPSSAPGNLTSETCKEIVEPKPEEEFREGDQEGEGTERKEGEEEEEDHVDPNDPLYGLDQRLKNLEIDEESKRIIKEKLEEASGKIKTQLEERQKNLDAKLAEKAGPGKKK